MPADDVDIEQPEQLIAYLSRTNRLPEGDIEIRVLTGGVSNKTVLITSSVHEAWVLKQALPKLRVQSDWFSDPSRIQREALGLRWLERIAPPGSTVPLIFEDFEHNILAMAAVPQPHENWKTLLLRGDVREDHIRQFAQLLGVIHRAGHERRDELVRVFDDRSFFESLRLEPYYAFAAQNAPGASEFLTKLIEETRRRRLSLVHGDYSPKNILVHNDRLILLDHEVIHWSDPAFDIGFALTHLLSKAHHLSLHRGEFASAAREFFSIYRSTAGDDAWLDEIERMSVMHTLGCLLARVAGRSPLEYLNDDERRRQRGIVVELMGHQPRTVQELINEFVSMLERHGDD